MAITNFVRTESDRAVHEELNDTKFFIVWWCLVLVLFENAKWYKIYGIELEKLKKFNVPPIFSSFTESEIFQSASWSKGKKQSDNK